MSEQITAIVVAAGQASRYGAPKILQPIGGTPAVMRVLRTFSQVSELNRLVLVVNEDIRPEINRLLAGHPEWQHISIIQGGDRRQDSVAAGVDAVNNADIVVIHDGARPFVTAQLIRDTIQAVQAGADAAIAALPLSDTVKRRHLGSVTTIDRTELWRAQTPQAFRLSALKNGLAMAKNKDLDVTDEATLIEMSGGRVVMVPGSELNLKLTTPEDLALAEAIANTQSVSNREIRTGIGYDVHRLVPGRKLILGGVDIPFDRGLEGHSDADVLLHAICDAILGACALGDIGQHFPPSDEEYRDIRSVVLLERVCALISDLGGAVINIDATVVAEEPRLGPYSQTMRELIAGALRILPAAVSVKATTNEGLGFAGRAEGIAAMAVATVRIPA